jgi:xanthine dehydrogenase accessory factor
MRLVIVGSGPTAEHLAELSGALGYGEIRLTDEVPDDLGGADHVVVATDDAGEGERQLLRAARGVGFPAYLGLAGSKDDGLRALVRLAAEKIGALRLGAIHAPAGIDVGAETAAEVAISVAAELVAVRRGRLAPGRAPINAGAAPPDSEAN